MEVTRSRSVERAETIVGDNFCTNLMINEFEKRASDIQITDLVRDTPDAFKSVTIFSTISTGSYGFCTEMNNTKRKRDEHKSRRVVIILLTAFRASI